MRRLPQKSNENDSLPSRLPQIATENERLPQRLPQKTVANVRLPQRLPQTAVENHVFLAGFHGIPRSATVFGIQICYKGLSQNGYGNYLVQYRP